MTAFFLALLGLAWVAFILPSALRARQTTPFTQAQRFKRRMGLLAPTRSTSIAGGGRWILAPDPSYDRLTRETVMKEQRKRQITLLSLLGAVIVSAIAAVFIGGKAWAVQLVLDGSFTLYVGLLMQAKARRVERHRKVRSIAPYQRRRNGPVIGERVRTGTDRRW